MKLYFNKTFGEYVCAGNGVAAMDKNRQTAIDLAFGMLIQKDSFNVFSKTFNKMLDVEEARATGN